MKKKLILFDWGNIVEAHTTGYSCRDAWNDLFHTCGYTGKEDIFRSLGKYHLSSIKNDKEFKKVYTHVAKEFNFTTTYKEFVKIYYEIFDKIDYYQDVADYEHSLKDKCSIGILSNLTIFDKERLDKQVDLSKYDYVFLSFELGLRKPDKQIYEEVQKQVPFASEDILFIDDRKDNIDSASSLGWNTYQITGLELDKIKERCNSFINDNDIHISLNNNKVPYIKKLTNNKIINLTGQTGSGKSTYALNNYNNDKYLIVDTDEILSDNRFNTSKGINKELGLYFRNKYTDLPNLSDDFDLIYKEIIDYCSKYKDKTIVIDCAQFHCIKDISLLKGTIIILRTSIDTCYNRAIERYKLNNPNYTEEELNNYKERKKAIYEWYKQTNNFIDNIEIL